MYDVAIIGAGPAGSTLARLVGSKHKVLLVERRRLCGGTSGSVAGKCCGGLVAPDAQKMLAALGLGLPESVLVGPQLFAVRAMDLPTGRERFYQRHYINIDREAFDRYLVSLLPGCVDLREGWTFRGFARDRGGLTVRLTRGQRTLTERARMLVGADGAGSAVCRLAAPNRPQPRTYLAVQETFACAHPPPHFCAFFDAEVTDYYAWSIPKGDRVIVGAALPAARGVRRRFEMLKERLRPLGLAAGKPLRRQAALILRPMHPSELCLGSGRVAMIGEAAGWISPSSAEGLSFAFASAASAAEAMATGPDTFARAYRRLTRALRRGIALKAVKAKLIYAPAMRTALLRSGIGAMSVSMTAPVLPQPTVDRVGAFEAC